MRCTSSTHAHRVAFPDEEPTQPIPFETLAVTAARWRAQQQLEEKSLRPLASDEETTQRIEAETMANCAARYAAQWGV